MDLIEAFQLAADLHVGQVDKAGRPYIEHLTRVMLHAQATGCDLEQQMAALLHDSIEDGHTTAKELLERGVPAGAVALVQTLTKPAEVSYDTYLDAVCANPRAVSVKLVDFFDNRDEARLALLPQREAERLRQKYDRAARRLLQGVSWKRK